MTTDKRNSKSNILNSVLFIAVFSLGLLLFHNSSDNHVVDRCAVVTEAASGDDNAIISPAADFQSFRVCLTVQKISFISTTSHLLTENKKSNLLLSQLEKTNYRGKVVLPMFCCHHLFPAENDDQPPLS